MSIYAIGDIQGCYDELLKLLDVVEFDENSDRLWFAGDLVNRGPKSLETLRFVKSLGETAVTVLGNHDLHLLATALKQRKAGKKDSLTPILEAPDRDELLHWLRHRPLFHHDGDFCLVHAGLPPQWDFAMTEKMARQVETLLQGPGYMDFFRSMYGDKPSQWSERLNPFEQARFTVNCFTRMRYCDLDGKLDFSQKGPLGSQPEHLLPWFAVPGRKSADMKIIFGHWSTLGYHESHNCYAIDTGCLWGGELTALKLGKRVNRFSVGCLQAKN
ncbi:symmetrical bis(5'-nucleosyl)-tetraphosphatase [Methylomarinum vadi]|uniref:symmetrical bis(5'-nucleosyl)-tetraphosphatase n=1 Tax=Methylomarinum vadi TaxID=438855 RepID=UPI0004DEE4F4|nr:symmetrical bis(5'-nucleosyl)-tetraphosphatase [Methylomarinum vadi]